MAGPAWFFASTPVSVKMPVPMTIPMPNPMRSQAVSRLLSRAWWWPLPLSLFCSRTVSTSLVRNTPFLAIRKPYWYPMYRLGEAARRNVAGLR